MFDTPTDPGIVSSDKMKVSMQKL